MKRAELEALALEELYRVAKAAGIHEAAGLPREVLVDRLASDPSPARARPPTARVDPAEARRAAAAIAGAGAPAAPGDEPRAGQPDRRGSGPARRHAAAIPSGVAQSRPQEHDTESMARLYLDQRDFQRAAELYRELLQLRPADPEYTAALQVAEAEIDGAPAAPPQPPGPRPADEPTGMLDLEEPPEHYGIDECEVLFKDPHYLFVYWEVTESGMGAARRDLGDEGPQARLVIRLFATIDRADRGPDREHRDHAVDWNHGRRYFPSPRPGARVRAAVGLVTPTGLFAPIAHSSQVRVPPSEPAAAVSNEWMEVHPARTRGLEREPIVAPRHNGGTGERPVALPGGALGGPDAPLVPDPGAGEGWPSTATPLGGGSERNVPGRPGGPAGAAPGGPVGSESNPSPASSPSSPWRWRPGSQS